MIRLLPYVLALVTGLLFLGSKQYHLDEVASIVIARDGGLLATKLWQFEGNMWLYYALLHVWLQLGENEAVVRGLSVLFGVVTLLPFYLLAHKLAGKKVAVLAIFLLPLHLVFVKNMQLARGYSLQMFLLVVSHYLLLRLLEKRNIVTLLLYSLVSALAVYTHMYSGLVLAAHFSYTLYLKDTKKLTWVIAAHSIILAAIAPLFLSPAFASGQINWIATPDFYTFAATVVMVTGDYIPLSIVILILSSIYIWRKKQGLGQDTSFVFTALCITIPLSIALVLSYLVKPFYAIHYFAILVPIVVIFTSQAVVSLKSKKFFSIFLLLIVALSCYRLALWYTSTPQRYMAISNVNTPWLTVVKYIEKNREPEDAVIVVPTYTYISYNFYANFPSVALQPLRLETGKAYPFNTQLLQTVPQKFPRIWYLYNKRSGSEQDPQKTEIEKVLKTSYTKTNEQTWHELQLTLYEKKP